MKLKLIEKSVIVSELEKRIEETKGMQPKFDQFWAGQISAFKGVLKILDTLEVKEVEEPSNDLEEAATKYAQDKYMPVQTAEAFRAGYNKCRQEMMNSAIEREVKEDAGGYPYIDATELYDYDNDKPLAKAGDKVKVLIIKDKGG